MQMAALFLFSLVALLCSTIQESTSAKSWTIQKNDTLMLANVHNKQNLKIRILFATRISTGVLDDAHQLRFIIPGSNADDSKGACEPSKTVATVGEKGDIWGVNAHENWGGFTNSCIKMNTVRVRNQAQFSEYAFVWKRDQTVSTEYKQDITKQIALDDLFNMKVCIHSDGDNFW